MPKPLKVWKPRHESYAAAAARLRKQKDWHTYNRLRIAFVEHGITEQGDPSHYLAMRYFPPPNSGAVPPFDPDRLLQKLTASASERLIANGMPTGAMKDVDWDTLEDSGDFRSDLQWAFGNAMRPEISADSIPSPGAALLWTFAQDNRKEFLAQVTRVLGKDSEQESDKEKEWMDDKRRQLELVDLLFSEEEELKELTAAIAPSSDSDESDFRFSDI